MKRCKRLTALHAQGERQLCACLPFGSSVASHDSLRRHHPTGVRMLYCAQPSLVSASPSDPLDARHPSRLRGIDANAHTDRHLGARGRLMRRRPGRLRLHVCQLRARSRVVRCLPPLCSAIWGPRSRAPSERGTPLCVATMLRRWPALLVLRLRRQRHRVCRSTWGTAHNQCCPGAQQSCRRGLCSLLRLVRAGVLRPAPRLIRSAQTARHASFQNQTEWRCSTRAGVPTST